MPFFTQIKPSEHYLACHAQEVPWEKAVEIVLSCKCPRKTGNRYRIETEKHYILFEIKDGTLYIINAKQR